ncbi:MAG: aminodeoxychorismate/anthranilate synthase component II [Alphaproteobacteria bacterium]|nr:aminodeoxychorismate/anthranilate synthase component II [Alphaproteobacteria bacterium]
MIILIDNYDSFTYNLVQYVGTYEQDIMVIRNDACDAREILSQNPDGIIISPGPKSPNEAGICLDLVRKTAETNIPLFGVCLGHQSIGQAFGGNIIKAPKPIHGKTSQINHNGKGLYKDIPSPLKITRYHSLIIETETCPECLEVTATTDDNIIMSLAHKQKPIFGVQYHPESIATEHGMKLIENFVKITKS